MKCKKCGHLNKSGMYYCVKCGSSLQESNDAIRKYKQTVKNESFSYKTLSKTQKFIIILVIIGLLILVLSAVTPPDMQLPSMATPNNNTQEPPIQMTDQTLNKLNTTIQIEEIGSKVGEKVNVKAYITDENKNRVTGGTTSITIDNTKYSGQVENGHANIQLPELSQNTYEATVVYEGNDEYNPSETKAIIEVKKEDTKIETQQYEDKLIITLKTASDNPIPDQTITITGENNAQTEEKTDSEGKINLQISQDMSKQKININYVGNDKYNPTEKIVEVGHDKKSTHLDTQYNKVDQTITVTLTDGDNNRIPDAVLTIKTNNQEKQEKTNNEGLVKIAVEEGTNEIAINYEGNTTLKGTNTTVNTVINHNTTENNTQNMTTNKTQENTTNNSTNQSTAQNDTKNNNTKLDTKLDMEYKQNQTIITLTTDTNEKLIGENITIKLDNGTVLTEKTDSEATIKLDINLEDIKEIKLEYEGNDKYNPSDKIIKINH